MSRILGSENNWIESFNDKGPLIFWCATSKEAPVLFKVSVDGFSDPTIDVLDHVIDRLTEYRSRIRADGAWRVALVILFHPFEFLRSILRRLLPFDALIPFFGLG